MTLLWDVRSALEEGEAKMLEGIIEKNKSKTSYYIFKHSNWTGHGMDTMKSTYMLMSKKPMKMLGTILWLVDNVKGSLTKLWELPLDIDLEPGTLDVGVGQKAVHDSMGGVQQSIILS